MEKEQEFKKYDRVQVTAHTTDFLGQVGTVVAVSRWVFGGPKDIVFSVALDSGVDVICDAQDLKLAEEED